ncbi:MAG: PQQ-dependent sugar dehydrogenase [Nitrospiria bacterium]
MRVKLSFIYLFSLLFSWTGVAETAFAEFLPCQLEGSSLSNVSAQLRVLTSSFDQPLGLAHAKDHSGRLYVAEQKGMVWIIENGKKKITPFLDIRKNIISGGEKGLLGIAFHPKYIENRRFFVNYTILSSANQIKTVIAEYKAKVGREEAEPESIQPLLLISQPFSNHKGGNLVFGPDGFLYIGLGDGGSANDPFRNGQNLQTLLGKMLRIDVDHISTGKKYSIPADNPFVGNKQALPEIWAYGLRNPWRYSFDFLTGILYVGDVGQDHREEIDIVQKGKNYGWNIMEGSICTPGVNSQCEKKGLELPLYDYGRSEGTVVIGGYVYRGNNFPSLCGTYIYGDFGNGRVWGIRRNGMTVIEHSLLLETHRKISSFGEDENHELYLVDYDGEILKLDFELR